MIFRNINDQKIKSVNKLDYLSDKEYIEHIKKLFDLSKLDNSDNYINKEEIVNNFLKKYNIPDIDCKNN